jgi:16S rRNA processing protein RimM
MLHSSFLSLFSKVHNIQTSLLNDQINIGKIVATFGVKGELILLHALGKKIALKNIEAIFIEEQKDSRLPYFIKTSKAKTEEETFVTLEGIDSKEAAKKLLQKKVWLPQSDFRKLADKSSPIFLIGFQLINEGKKIGLIEEVIEQPHQVLLRINFNDKEALIPLHEETLDKIDHKKMEVYVTLPDGLLELYS